MTSRPGAPVSQRAKLSPHVSSPSTRVIRRAPQRGWVALDLCELWHYRELLLFQAVRDIKVRYSQTVLGALWAILQPVLMMAVFSVVFGRFAGLTAGDVPYPAFVLCGLVPWQLFSYTLARSSNCLVDHAHTLKKVYFPRLVLPLASVLTGLVDFAIAGAVLAAVLLYYGIVPGWPLLLAPLFALLAAAAALSVGLWLSALNVRYRDVRHIVPFLAQLWLFATPVAYPTLLVPERWQALYGLNPMAGVVDGFRWALLDAEPPRQLLIASTSTIGLLLVSGLYYFRRTERTFADVA